LYKTTPPPYPRCICSSGCTNTTTFGDISSSSSYKTCTSGGGFGDISPPAGFGDISPPAGFGDISSPVSFIPFKKTASDQIELTRTLSSECTHVKETCSCAEHCLERFEEVDKATSAPVALSPEDDKFLMHCYCFMVEKGYRVQPPRSDEEAIRQSPYTEILRDAMSNNRMLRQRSTMFQSSRVYSARP